MPWSAAAAARRCGHETVVRLMAADLVDPAAVLEGLQALGEKIEAALADVGAARTIAHEALPHRRHLLDVNHR
jgi:hypothetical protein